MQQVVVAGKTEDIIDAIGFAPVHQVGAGETGIAPDQNFDLGPVAADVSHHPFDRRLGTLGAIDVAVTEFGQQQMRATVDIQRQEAAVFVIAMKKSADLLAVGFDVGGVDVQHDPLRWGVVAGGEQIDIQILQPGRVGGDLVVTPVGHLETPLQSPQRRTPGQRRQGGAGVRSRFGACRHPQQRIMAQLVVVVDVFIAQRDPDDPLRQQIG